MGCPGEEERAGRHTKILGPRAGDGGRGEQRETATSRSNWAVAAAVAPRRVSVRFWRQRMAVCETCAVVTKRWPKKAVPLWFLRQKRASRAHRPVPRRGGAQPVSSQKSVSAILHAAVPPAVAVAVYWHAVAAAGRGARASRSVARFAAPETARRGTADQGWAWPIWERPLLLTRARDCRHVCRWHPDVSARSSIYANR
jgi:hypothetical protein